jgi:hypothetical protein
VQELRALLAEERLAGASLLVLANKQDVAGALPPERMQQARPRSRGRGVRGQGARAGPAVPPREESDGSKPAQACAAAGPRVPLPPRWQTL